MRVRLLFRHSEFIRFANHSAFLIYIYGALLKIFTHLKMSNCGELFGFTHLYSVWSSLEYYSEVALIKFILLRNFSLAENTSWILDKRRSCFKKLNLRALALNRAQNQIKTGWKDQGLSYPSLLGLSLQYTINTRDFHG